MTISVINHTNGKISDEEVQGAIRAINRQIKEDFERNLSLVQPQGLRGTYRHETFLMKGDQVAAERLKIKMRSKAARRAIRYRRFAMNRKGTKTKTTLAIAYSFVQVEPQRYSRLAGLGI